MSVAPGVAHAESQNGVVPVGVPFVTYSLAELRNLPPVAWLIDRLLVAAAFVVPGRRR